jgi:hypothetical protein
MGDRDVFGYTNIMQSTVLGEWDVIHQDRGTCREAKKRKEYVDYRRKRERGSGYCSR